MLPAARLHGRPTPQNRNEKYRRAAENGGVGGGALNVETMYTSSQNHETMCMDAKETMCTSSLQAALVVRCRQPCIFERKRAESAIHYIAQRRESAASVTLGIMRPQHYSALKAQLVEPFYELPLQGANVTW